MNIALACNSKKSSKEYLAAEYDSDNTIRAICDSLEKMGHSVRIVEAGSDAYASFNDGKSKTDLVFNIAEGLPGECRESQIPAILDIYDIPHTGPGIRATAICMNKHVTKLILKANGIPTPKWTLYPSDSFSAEELSFPFVLKPAREGSSIGITGESSLARNHGDMLEKAADLHDKYSQHILIEEFLPGAEITVGIFGNSSLEVLPLLEIYTEMYPPSCLNMATADAKTIFESDDFSGPPRDLSPATVKLIEDMARRTYRMLGCRDFGRVDFRLDAGGVPNVMEVNPIPGINPEIEEVSYFTKICRMAGMTYDQMISKIVDETMERLQFR